MSDHLKSNTVINLENMQKVVLSVHGHQLEVKYQQKDVEQLNQDVYTRETHSTSTDGNLEKICNDKSDSTRGRDKIGELFDTLHKLCRSELEEVCITSGLNSLRRVPQGCPENSLINEMVSEAERIKKIEDVLKRSLKLINRSS